MENIKQFFTGDRYAKLSGIELLSVSPGLAVAQMKIQPHHMNAVGSVQGGAIFTLADLAFAAASNPNFRVAPFSAVLVLLLGGQLGEGPIESALIRVS